MGEFIKLQFGKRKVAPKPANAPGQTLLDKVSFDKVAMERLQVLSNDAVFVLQKQDSIETIRLACATGDEATDYIFSMADFRKKDENVDLRKDALQLTPLKTLCEYLGNSTKGQWQVQPHYVGALVLEINERLKVMRKVCNNIEIPNFKD